MKATLILLVLIGACNSPQKETAPSNKAGQLNNADSIAMNSNSSDSSFAVNGTRLRRIKKAECSHAAESESAFVQSNIGYFTFDAIDSAALENREFYRLILISTQFLFFEPHQFDRGTFILRKINVNNYGMCIWAKFLMPTSPGSGQDGVSVLVNVQKKELSIWHYSDISIGPNKITTVFKVRGRSSAVSVEYSESCGEFIAGKH
ncbi:MAG TPA: hypothetical protein VEB40_16160 [Flavipsychrobacter sp.]|nr:hypothetical protein [Flavipsychrobacter sp.]